MTTIANKPPGIRDFKKGYFDTWDEDSLERKKGRYDRRRIRKKWRSLRRFLKPGTHLYICSSFLPSGMTGRELEVLSTTTTVTSELHSVTVRCMGNGEEVVLKGSDLVMYNIMDYLPEKIAVYDAKRALLTGWG